MPVEDIYLFLDYKAGESMAENAEMKWKENNRK